MLAEALRQNPETFLPAARARLIDDAFSLAFADLLPYSIVFDIIDYLPENDRDPEPWSYLLHHAMKLNLALYGSPVYISYQVTIFHKYFFSNRSQFYTKLILCKNCTQPFFYTDRV